MEPVLPTGTLTLMFSDIEGSTVALSRLGDRYADALSEQRAILRSAIAAGHGREMGTEGDSFFVVFESAHAGISAALQAQRELSDHDWPGGEPIRVRMGLHTGEPVVHEEGYVGMDVHRAARIASSAHGGQVVVSDATRQLAEPALPDGAGFVDLGWHRFKDLGDPEHVHQLTAPGLPTQFPPLKSLGTRVNLPEPPTALVGRDDELADLQRLLSSEARLVTLTGPGGTGKTRLAIAAAGSLDASFSDGVYFVPLATVTGTDIMWSTIAETLGITGEGRAPPTFFEHIAHRAALLVLDNLEHLAEAPDVVSELLRAGPRLAVIATSRRALHLPGEYERPVTPLDYPADEKVDPATAAGCSAVQLFVQRAKMVRPSFELTADNAADVVALCRGLDGLPLAIELAAARVRLLSPAALRARLGQALELAAVGRDRPDRHVGLRQTIAWSYDLLPPEQQWFFRQLGVFSGGADLPALTAVTESEDDVLDPVAALVDASLATVREAADGEPRIHLLQTIGAYALERLQHHGELDTARSRHAAYYAGLAEELDEQLRTDKYHRIRDRIEGELDNFRAALTWAFGNDQSGERDDERLSTGLRLCRELSWFWYAAGYAAEGRQWQSLALEQAGDVETEELVATLHGMAVLLSQQGRLVEARDAMTRALDFWRRQGNRSRTALELNSLGLTYRSLGDQDTARTLLQESVDISREIGEPNRLATALTNLATLEVDADRPEAAIDMLNEALELDRGRGDAWGVAVGEGNLALAMVIAGRLEDAEDLLRAITRRAVELDDVDLTIGLFEVWAMVRAEQGDAEGAARLIGMTDTMREQAELPLPEPDRAVVSRSLNKLGPALSSDSWRRAADEGSSYSVEQALTDVLEHPHNP